MGDDIFTRISMRYLVQYFGLSKTGNKVGDVTQERACLPR